MPRLLPLLALLLGASASASLRADVTKGTPHGDGTMKAQLEWFSQTGKEEGKK